MAFKFVLSNTWKFNQLVEQEK